MPDFDPVDYGRHGLQKYFGFEQQGRFTAGGCAFLPKPCNGRPAVCIDDSGRVVVLDDVLHRSDYSQKFPGIDRLVPRIFMKNLDTAFQIDPPEASFTAFHRVGRICGDPFCGAVHRRMI